MKSFFKTFFACLLAIGTFLFLGIIIIIILGSMGDSPKSIKDHSILHLKFDVPVVDRANDNPFANIDMFTLSSESNIGLNDVLKNIERAKNDPNIQGIFIETTMIEAGMATIEEIRDAIVDFKTSGKFTVAYSEMYSQKDYYLASGCDKVYLFPTGLLEFRGLNKSVMFLKGTLEKLGIEPQVIRHGKFKSAIEPLILDKMSEANKEQSINYVSDLWLHLVKGISETRKIDESTLLSMAENLDIQNPEDALKHKMVDGLKYRDEIIDELKKMTEKGEKDDLELVSNSKYADTQDKTSVSEDKVAVIYAMGDIVSGKGKEDELGSDKISKEIRKARMDENVKAIVLRVNSPGGSALASDVIWREMVLAKQTKPVVVSMGDVAASGGYFISCAANEILASENTITGSIGVFGVLPNMQKLFEEKLGLTFDGVKTSQYADLGALNRPLTESERNIIQASVEDIYDDFITKVGDGRGIKKADVDSIGQGRVWSGIDAKQIKLVDNYGGLQKAIVRAAELARLEKYDVQELPEKKEPLEAILEGFAGEEAEAKILKEKLGNSYEYIKMIEKFSTMSGVQARLPYEFRID